MGAALSFPSRDGEIVRCPTHQWAWHTRAAGCGICKSHRIAQQLIDKEPTARGSSSCAATADVVAVGSASMRELEAADRDMTQAVRVCAQLERDLFAAMTGGAS